MKALSPWLAKYCPAKVLRWKSRHHPSGVQADGTDGNEGGLEARVSCPPVPRGGTCVTGQVVDDGVELALGLTAPLPEGQRSAVPITRTRPVRATQGNGLPERGSGQP